MLRIIVALVCLGVGVRAQGQSLIHQIIIPSKYAWGCEAPVTCASPAEKDANMYERGWWHCLGKKGEDIDYTLTLSDRAASGTPASVDGWSDGCSAAERHVQLMIAKFGRDEAAHFLRTYVVNLLNAGQDAVRQPSQ
jgi:hypothetical protein